MKRVITSVLILLIAVAASPAFEVKPLREVGPTAFIRWSTSAFPIPFVIDSKGSEDAGFADSSSAINNAFSAWQNVSKQTMRFTFSGQRTPATVNCADRTNSLLWIEGNWPASSFILAITNTTFFIQDPPDLIDADISFNGRDFTWSESGGSGDVSIQAVAQHEIGHMIGLQHSQVRGAIMLPGGSDTVILSKDDKAAIRFLYPSSAPSKFKILSPLKKTTLLEGSSALPPVTFRWTLASGLTNFVVEFSSTSDFSPANQVISVATGSANFLEETSSLRKQLKNLAGEAKKIFWHVQADSSSGRQTTKAANFLFQ